MTQKRLLKLINSYSGCNGLSGVKTEDLYELFLAVLKSEYKGISFKISRMTRTAVYIKISDTFLQVKEERWFSRVDILTYIYDLMEAL